MALALNRAAVRAEEGNMTVMQALENVQTAAKKLSPLVPDILSAVTQVGGDFTAHKSAMTDVMDAVMLAEQIIAAATGI